MPFTVFSRAEAHLGLECSQCKRVLKVERGRVGAEIACPCNHRSAVVHGDLQESAPPPSNRPTGLARCPDCQGDVGATAKFCPHCGSRKSWHWRAMAAREGDVESIVSGAGSVMFALVALFLIGGCVWVMS